MHAPRRVYAIAATLAMVTLSAVGAGTVAAAQSGQPVHGGQHASTATPIKHLVVIFDENVSFDHYFGTYPFAANLPGERPFHAKPGTPLVNGLYTGLAAGQPSGPLLTSNPNKSNPLRLGPSDPMTCDQDHNYTAEQDAADHGAEDAYPQNTGYSETLAQCLAGEYYRGAPESVPAGAGSNYAVMDYYDGNTVTGLWNYAQHFAMNDNAFETTYGPSTPGALNVTAAQTYGALCGPSSATINDAPCTAPPGYNTTSVASSDITTSASGPTSVAGQPAAGPGTAFGDADPTFDICSYLPSSDGGDGRAPASTLAMGGNNIGEELTTAHLTWGWFEGGFDKGYVPGQGTQPTTAQICAEQHQNVGGSSVTDYIPHHEPFEYYASTANPMHLPPTSVAAIGRSDQANHQYDSAGFWAAADAGNLPAVSYLKAPAYQDGHAGYSNPLDEQAWLATTINHLESLRTWGSTAVVVTYDDSDGWYDSILGPIATQSQTSLDSLTGTGACGSDASQVPVNSAKQPEQGRCGAGPRLPFLVISPWAKSNYVDSSFIDQSSVVKFIEYNWRLPALGNGAVDTAAGSIAGMLNFHGRRNPPLFLDPATGQPARRH
jgi:phospholipase C